MHKEMKKKTKTQTTICAHATMQGHLILSWQ